MLYRYKGIDSQTGKEVRGSITAASEVAASEELKKKGFYIVELKSKQDSILHRDLTTISLGPPVKNQEFVIFCRQLATLLKASTPIVDAINLLSQQASSKPFKQALERIYQDIRSGTAFSRACAQFPNIFDSVFVNMVIAGETSGDLENVMDRLALFYEKDRKVKEKVKSALIYPITVSILAVIVVIILLTKVLPSLLNNLITIGGEIPVPTQIVMSLSDFLLQKWYLLVLLLGIIVIGFIAMKRNPKGSYLLDYVTLKVPVFGILIQKTILARITRTMASLFASSVPVLQILTMSAEVAGNKVVAEVLEEAKNSLRRGESLSAPLEKSWIFPSITTHMIRIGEETGQLDAMLEKIADFYEDDVEQTSSRLTVILEPLMIAVLGGIVGLIVLAALLPMFSVYENL